MKEVLAATLAYFMVPRISVTKIWSVLKQRKEETACSYGG
jgi:hypothetical protein